LDLGRKQLHIRRTFNHGRYFEPKKKGNIRKIDMTPVLVKELVSWKLASGGRGDDLIFPSGDGMPMICHNMKKTFLSGTQGGGDCGDPLSRPAAFLREHSIGPGGRTSNIFRPRWGIHRLPSP